MRLRQLGAESLLEGRLARRVRAALQQRVQRRERLEHRADVALRQVAPARLLELTIILTIILTNVLTNMPTNVPTKVPTKVPTEVSQGGAH